MPKLNVRIRSTRDALQVFYAVARTTLPLITRRLDAEERRAIAPGNVYVWEERGANTEATGLGMERWTDGMGWGPSRVRDEFLFYHQKEFDIGDDTVNPVTPWAQMIRVYPASHSRTSETERLVKQTYSVHVSLPVDRPRGIIRKWHLTAYFSQNKLDALETIDSLRGIGDVVVPDDWFRSARANKSRRENRDTSGNLHQLAPAGPSGGRGSSSAYSHHSSPQSPHSPVRASMPSHTPSFAPPPAPSSPSSPTPPTTVSHLAPGGRLVPLEYLQNVSYPRRDPTDEQLLRRFTMKSVVSAVPSQGYYPRDP
ncbi:hypothetical protein HGRIS_000324 [Hohenbuehelia grisea]|uniref:cAMP-independent regulatory protein pac2 n=1 Tax=Hohenbuehelia grisea TaxID=104357 RepID=A0ABR3JQQ4_9AGAR